MGEILIDNEASIKRLAEISVGFALAGADIVAPSDMMDGRIAAIKAGLNDCGLGNKVSIDRACYETKSLSILIYKQNQILIMSLISTGRCLIIFRKVCVLFLWSFSRCCSFSTIIWG